MEQTNLNNSVNQLKGMLGFLTPNITFIVNACFAVVAFLFFILQEGFMNVEMMTTSSIIFKYAGGILGFIIMLGLTVAAVAMPLKTNRLASGVNFFIAGFMILFSLFGIIPWKIITILNLILILLPWMCFTFIKKGDEVRL